MARGQEQKNMVTITEHSLPRWPRAAASSFEVTGPKTVFLRLSHNLRGFWKNKLHHDNQLSSA